jgi:hypothetical protein
MAEKKKWIQGAVKHEGRLTEAAKRAGVSKLEMAEKWSHSSDPSKRGAGNLGKRFIKGKLHEGGTVPEDGLYELKAGEQIVPAFGRSNKQINVEINVPSTPSMGTKMKVQDDYEDTLRKGSLPDAEKVTDAKEEPGAAKRCLDAQLGRHDWSASRTGGNLGDATMQPNSGSCYDDGGAGVPGYEKPNK